MATNIILSEDNFFKSNQIKIYPASFRGVYGENNTKFDPESTLTTEYNITRPSIAGDKETYIISWNKAEGKLICVIGGYYFEISNVTASALANKYLCITKRTIDLTDEFGTDNQRSTSVLANFRDSSASLDELEENKGYFFTGLLISDSAAGDFRLKVFLTDGAINYAEFLPKVQSGDGNANNQPTALVFGTDAKAMANRSIAIGDGAKAEGDHSFAIGKGASATDIGSLAIGHDAKASNENAIALGHETQALAEGAIAIGTKSKASGIDSQARGYKVTAEGKYSQASGNQTKTIGEASVAEGDNTIASGNYSHASGKETEAIGICSNAFGNNTVAGFENQFVLGTFNDNKEGNIFEIGNGKTGALKNIFEVDNEGNTALHSLKASGNITVTGTANLGNKVKVEADSINLTTPTTFEDVVTIKNKLTISKDIEVSGKLTTDNNETTIYKQLKIQNNEKEDTGEYNLIYDSKTGSLAIGNHLGKGKGSVSFTSGSDATGINAFTIGQGNHVSGENSAAFGQNNYVAEKHSFASGTGNNITGSGAVVAGSNNINNKNNAAVFGSDNIANSEGELVIGKYNANDVGLNTEYFAIGNGTVNKRNTAFRVVKKAQNSQTEVFIDDKSVATHVSEDANFKDFLLNSLYPVGSVYIYSGTRSDLVTKFNDDFNLCPIQHTLGGTWEAIEERFLYAGDQKLGDGGADTDYNCINHKGGSNEAYLVEHTHDIDNNEEGLDTSTALTNNMTIGIPTGDNGRATVWPNSHWCGHCDPTQREQNKWTNNYGPDLDTVGKYEGEGRITIAHEAKESIFSVAKAFDKNGQMHENDMMNNKYRLPTTIKFDLNHKHTIPAHKHTCQKYGTTDENDATANMPQYLCVYAWKRVK